MAIVRGFVAGVLATVPMTAVMLVLNRLLPPGNSDTLPPQEITENAAEKADVPIRKPERLLPATTLAHFGYGGAMGVLYSLLAPRITTSPAAKGTRFAMLVWSGSYLGLMPALRLYPSATREPARMNGLMIAAHLVWGAVLGQLFSKSRLRRLPI